MHIPGFGTHLSNDFLLVLFLKQGLTACGNSGDALCFPEQSDCIQKVFSKAIFQHPMREVITGNPGSACFIQTAAGNQHMDMHMPGETSPEGVHDQEKARKVAAEGIPVREGLADNRVEAIEISFSVHPKVGKKFMRRREDDMLVFALRKEGRILLNPYVGLAYPTGRAKPRFTGMGNLSLKCAGGTAVVVIAHLLCAAAEHFINI